MGVTLVAVGTFLIAAGPALALLLGVLVPNPHLVVLAVTAAFVWSIALSLSGTVYWMIPPLRETYPWLLFVTVLFQELTRLGLYEVFRFMFKSGDGVQAFLRPGAKNDALTGMSIGVGYALMSVLVNFYSAVIDEFKDDTAIYTDTCSYVAPPSAGTFHRPPRPSYFASSSHRVLTVCFLCFG
jgi:Aph-1 protein